MIKTYEPITQTSEGGIKITLSKKMIQSGTAPAFDSGGRSITIESHRSQLHISPVYIPVLGQAVIRLVKDFQKNPGYRSEDVITTIRRQVFVSLFFSTHPDFMGNPAMIIGVKDNRRPLYKIILAENEWYPFLRALAKMVGSHQFREAYKQGEELKAVSREIVDNKEAIRAKDVRIAKRDYAEQNRLLEKNYKRRRKAVLTERVA